MCAVTCCSLVLVVCSLWCVAIACCLLLVDVVCCLSVLLAVVGRVCRCCLWRVVLCSLIWLVRCS